MRDVGDDRLAAMDLRDLAEVDRKSQLHNRALDQAKVACLNEHPVGTQVVGAAKLAATPRDADINRSARAMPRVQSSFHLPFPASCSWRRMSPEYAEASGRMEAGKAPEWSIERTFP